MSTRAHILQLLCDGVFHSGADIGVRLGISRAAVCKNIRALTQAGLEIERVTGRGYRLQPPLTPLDPEAIRAALPAAERLARDELVVLEQADSTNRYLLQRLGERVVSGTVCLAEAQRAGRGRRGRGWIATPYHNLMLSMTWSFSGGPALLSGLSLVAGLAVARALEAYGAPEVGLKWPNDLLWRERKLAGLLVDVQGEAAGPTDVVVGVGINGYLGPADAARVDQAWADLRSITGAVVDRNRLAALVVRELRSALRAFAARGFPPFRREWERRHLYQGRRVRLIGDEAEHTGRVEGVDDSGALLVADARGRRRRFLSGEITLRPAA